MNGTYEIEYEAIGGWYNRYYGKVTVNASNEKEACQKARVKAAEMGCFAISEVTPTSVKLLFTF
jgi:hypothetical protein